MSKFTSWFGFSLRSFNFNESLGGWLSAAKNGYTFPPRLARPPREGVRCWPRTLKSSIQMHVFNHAALFVFHSGGVIRSIYIGSSKVVWYLHEAGDPNPSLMLLYHSLEHCLSAVEEASMLCVHYILIPAWQSWGVVCKTERAFFKGTT